MRTEYLSMSVEELAADQAVGDLTLHGKDAAAWDSWIEQNPDVAVRMSEAQQLIRELHAVVAEEQVDQERIDKLWKTISADTAPVAKVIGLRSWIEQKQWGKVAGVAVAAAAVLIFMLVYNPAGDVYATRRGEQLAFFLQDSTKVALAPESSLRVLTYKNGKRTVELRGEAFFEVKKGDPFLVKTPEGEVEVLGTSFSVKAFAKTFSVACATGRVRVGRKDAKQILTPGRAVNGTPDGLSEVQEVEITDIDGFTRNILQYHNISLSELGEELQRYYNRPVKIAPTDAARRVDIRIPSNDLPTVVSRLGALLQLQVDTTAGKIEIRK